MPQGKNLEQFWNKSYYKTHHNWLSVMVIWKVNVKVLVMSSSLGPIDCSLSVSSVHGILQARLLEWVAIHFFRGSSWPRDWIWVSCIAGRFFTIWATRVSIKQMLPLHWVGEAIQQTWVWVNSRSWWWTGRPGMLQFMGSQRVGHDWATELNWTANKATVFA